MVFIIIKMANKNISIRGAEAPPTTPSNASALIITGSGGAASGKGGLGGGAPHITESGGTASAKGGLGGGAPHIFRYKLSDDLMALISQFAKIHQYDDRHSYKDAWEHQWLNDYSEMVEREVSRLEQLGYKGDAVDKMYKAGRYYFREKESMENKNARKAQEKKEEEKEEAEKKEEEKEKKQRTYCVMNSVVIGAMDKHLIAQMQKRGFKPAHAYKEFCETHLTLLRGEITRLIQQEETMTAEQISNKIKKTYKNRYFILTKQHQ